MKDNKIIAKRLGKEMKKHYVQKSTYWEDTYEVVEIDKNGLETVVCEMCRTLDEAVEELKELVENGLKVL